MRVVVDTIDNNKLLMMKYSCSCYAHAHVDVGSDEII